MEEQKRIDRIGRIVRLAWSIPVVTLLSVIGMTANGIRQGEIREENARAVAMKHYVPVGNGGALAEMNGRLSPERKCMYNAISLVYYRAGGRNYFPVLIRHR